MDHYLLMGAAVLVILAAAYIALYNRLQRLRVKVEEAQAGIDVALEKRFDLISEEIEAVKKYLAHEYQVMTDLTAARTETHLKEKRIEQQQKVSQEALNTINREMEQQTKTMEQIRRQLDRGKLHRQARRGQNTGGEDWKASKQEALAQAQGQRGAALSQKMGTLAEIHRSLSSVDSYINGLAEQYPILNSWVPMDHFQRSLYDLEEHLQAARRLYNANVSLYNQALAAIPFSIVANLCHMEKAAFYEVEEHKRNVQVTFD